MKKIFENFKMELLSKRIYAFLDKYAAILPDWDGDEDEKYTSPDASEMKYCADMLKMNQKPSSCFSDWGSGGYKPYMSIDGKNEHNYLISEIYKIIKQ